VPTSAGDLIAEAEARMKRSPAIEHWPAQRERWEAEALLSHVLGRDDHGIADQEPVEARHRRRFRELVRRRAGGEPMGQVLGYTWFRGLRLSVRPGAFVPRQSSEFTAVQATRRLRGRRRPVAVDLATGIGPVALAVGHAVRKTRVYGTDLSDQAVRQARANARSLRLGNVSFHRGDLYGPIPREARGRVDVVTVHPPYVPAGEIGDLPLEVRGFEPEHTLTDYSPHGLVLAERAVVEGREWIRPGGWLLIEVSPDRSRTVASLLRRAGYGDVRSTKGWPSITRVVVGRR
jgi:release factor glutamine methyltransferase